MSFDFDEEAHEDRSAEARELRMRRSKESLLKDMPALMEKVKTYVKKGYMKGTALQTAKDILDDERHNGYISRRQWEALAGLVAYVDALEE